MAKALLIALQALAAAFSALPGLTGEVAKAGLAINAAVQGAIAEHNKAVMSVDPTQLVPEDPVV